MTFFKYLLHCQATAYSLLSLSAAPSAQQTNASPSPDHSFLFGIISSLTL